MVEKIKNKTVKFITEPHLIKDEHLNEIEKTLINYPYFQFANLCLSLVLYKKNSVRYSRQLKKTAILSLKRKVLFKYINTDYLNSIKQKSSTHSLLNSTSNINNLNHSEEHSFSQWLNVVKIKKIDRKSPTSNDQIEEKKNSQKKFFNASNSAKNSLIENDKLITPTLAKVYMQQEHYDKAISAYEKLILKIPKKSSFFANQIKLIKQLKKES